MPWIGKLWFGASHGWVFSPGPCWVSNYRERVVCAELQLWAFCLWGGFYQQQSGLKVRSCLQGVPCGIFLQSPGSPIQPPVCLQTFHNLPAGCGPDSQVEGIWPLNLNPPPPLLLQPQACPRPQWLDPWTHPLQPFVPSASDVLPLPNTCPPFKVQFTLPPPWAFSSKIHSFHSSVYITNNKSDPIFFGATVV